MNLTKVSIITGFLGVGKTTFIKHLLALRPANEKWAVIVNEFGQVGVDALLLEDDSVIIKQIPGGCACCAAQLPFQLALNQLLKTEKPNRILIEPSGLGHAQEISKILQQSQYENWLALSSVITLIDPMQYQQKKYREHEIYQQQLQAADALYLNKIEKANEPSIQTVMDYASSQSISAQLAFSVFDQSVLDWMDACKKKPVSGMFSRFQEKVKKPDSESALLEFYQASVVTDHTEYKLPILLERLKQSHFQRVKAVLNTDQGVVAINGVHGDIQHKMYDHDTQEFLIEAIDSKQISESDVNDILSAAQ